MRLPGSKIITTGMWPHVVIGVYSIINHFLCFFKAAKILIQRKLFFQYAVYLFQPGHFIRVALFCHANAYIIALQQGDVLRAAILHAPV